MATNKSQIKYNKPQRTSEGPKKIVRFGDRNMRIKKSNFKARKSFRSRHKCSTAKSKLTARYWSCRNW